jgi:hypothetical protein
MTPNLEKKANEKAPANALEGKSTEVKTPPVK